MAANDRESTPKKVFRVAYALNYCVQAAFSMLCPAGLLIFGGWLLVNKCGWGSWVMIVAIVFGVLVGFYSMFHFLMTTAYAIDPTANHRKEVPRDAGQADENKPDNTAGG